MEEKKYESEKLEAQKRFDALPENLKKELLADKNTQLVSNVCQDYSIPEDQVKIVAMIVGEVFLGYMKPEEIASELNQHFQIDMQKANFIEIELKQKLFNGLKSDLEKIYNPPKISEEAQEGENPKVVNFESFGAAPSSAGLPPSPPAGGFGRTSRTGEQDKKEAIPLTTIPSQPVSNIQKNYEQKIPSMGTGTASLQPQPVKSNQEVPVVEMPFIIQTKAETAKPAIPQFPKEALSLNLKADPSLTTKPPVIKPVSVRLESEQASNVKFTMPVFAKQQPTINDQQKTAQLQQSKPEIVQKTIANKEQPQTIITPQQTIDKSPVNLQPKITIPQIPVEPKIVTSQPTMPKMVASQPEKPKPVAISIQPEKPVDQNLNKPISELKPIEEPRTVHYSAFKTPLTPIGTPKKPEPKKEDYINLTTFTKISGNTVDLRNDKRPTTNN